MDEKQLISFIINNSSKIALDFLTGSDVVLSKIRKDVFVPKQKLSVIRTWFKIVPNVKLTDTELDITKKIIVKPKSSEWSIILTILRFQTQMSNESVLLWYKSIRPMDMVIGARQCIEDKRVIDTDYKIVLFKEMLNHYNYQLDAIKLLDKEIARESLWTELLKVLVDTINENDERSNRLVNHWVKNTINLTIFAISNNLKSPLLYSVTGNEKFLSQQVKDVFLF